MKALISPTQDNFIVQVENDENTFEVASPMYWLDCPEYVEAYQYKYIENQFAKYEAPPPTAEQNKQTAIDLLNQTDWTTIADVGNSDLSNPYLANQAEFIAWRSQIRAIAVNPTAGVMNVFYEMPAENWQTV